MPRTPAKITQADLARIFKAASQSGVSVVIEVLTDGTVRIVPSEKSDKISAMPTADKPKTLF